MKTFNKLSTLAALCMIMILSNCSSYNSKVTPTPTHFQSPYTNEDYPPDTIINGYTLPPEPDHVENDKTLLGIDTNHNNIRDDIERYIIIYEHTHPTWSEKLTTYVALEIARGIQIYFATGDVVPTAKMRSCNNAIDEYAKKHGLDFSQQSIYGSDDLSYNTQQRANLGLQLKKDFIDYSNKDDAISTPYSMKYCPRDPFSFGELPR